MRRTVIVSSVLAAIFGILAYGIYFSDSKSFPSGPLKDGEFVVAAFFS